MATYNDFLGEGGTGVNPQRPRDPNDDPNPANPGGISNNALQQIIANQRRAVATSPDRQGDPGLGYGGSPEQIRAARDDNRSRVVTSNAPNTPWADLARLGTAGVRAVYGTGIDTLGEAFGLGEEVRGATNPLEYGIRAAGDEAADQVIPGGSGVYGSAIIPGTGSATGGDTMYPSETWGNGYTEGYRGVGNPRANLVPAGSTNGQAAPGAGAGAGASSYVPGAGLGSFTMPEVAGPARPGAYRSDAVTPQIQQLLDAERRQGPSQAEALMTKATDRIAAQSLGIAAGARGGAGARERAGTVAASTNAAMGSQASAEIAALRAREDAESRQRQQGIMGLLAGNAETGDVRDLGYYTSDQGRASARENLGANIASNERVSQAELLQRAFEGEQERAARAFEAEQQRALTRDTFNAQQPTGFLDDPLAWGFGQLTGGRLRSGTKI